MNRALILMYHIVDKPRSSHEARFCVTPQDFDRQIRFLREQGYVPVSLDRIVDWLTRGAPLPAHAVAITFDDGFADTCEHAVPILQAHDVPATMFVVSGRLAGDNDWMQRRGAPRRRIMSASQLGVLEEAGVRVGSHTATHPRLTDLSPDSVSRELRDSKKALEDLLGHPVQHFAYPYGLFNEAVRDAVLAAGYRAACSTRAGFNRKGENPLTLRRIDIFGNDAMWQFRQKLRFGTNEASRSHPFRYYAGRIAARLGF
jgi:peptidoglycan/xylan/chitin deacetylase (PgdA/CDA1 family)